MVCVSLVESGAETELFGCGGIEFEPPLVPPPLAATATPIPAASTSTTPAAQASALRRPPAGCGSSW